MFSITTITLGKLKEKYWAQAEAEYLKRLTPYAKVNFIELKEESFDDKSKPEIIKQKEAEKIKNALTKFKDAYLIALNGNGKQFTSNQIAEQFNHLTIKQLNHFVFIIGGPLGLDPSIIKLANLQLSLSNLTFPHQMVRTILLEQIYRVMMINNNRQYHY
jgi:23S rRNA (pseudouridine1915-N3)-methyltransferase